MINWKIIEDVRIRHIWKDSRGNEEIALDPSWYQDNGTPVCPETGDDCIYVRTEILIESQ